MKCLLIFVSEYGTNINMENLNSLFRYSIMFDNKNSNKKLWIFPVACQGHEETSDASSRP